MVRALGFSNGPFNPFDAGRLCRGRERWIEPWEAPEGESAVVQRLVFSGATFTDLSAADAVRGLPHAGVEPASLLAQLFPRKTFVAFTEDGHPADIPDDAVGVELYESVRSGGRLTSSLVRWCKVVTGVNALRALLHEPADGSDEPSPEDRLRGFVVMDDAPDDPDAVLESLFPLVGFSTRDSPPARFQPALLPELVEHARAIVLIHRDKNGLALGVYTHEPLDVADKVASICAKADTLLVPFAIPPMLARWDRALAELRDAWTADVPFPVPEPEGGYNWENRRRRRRDRRKRPSEAKAEVTEDAPATPDAAESVAEEPAASKSPKPKAASKAKAPVSEPVLVDDDVLTQAEEDLLLIED